MRGTGKYAKPKFAFLSCKCCNQTYRTRADPISRCDAYCSQLWYLLQTFLSRRFAFYSSVDARLSRILWKMCMQRNASTHSPAANNVNNIEYNCNNPHSLPFPFPCSSAGVEKADIQVAPRVSASEARRDRHDAHHARRGQGRRAPVPRLVHLDAEIPSAHQLVWTVREQRPDAVLLVSVAVRRCVCGRHPWTRSPDADLWRVSLVLLHRRRRRRRHPDCDR